jgi:hypothetical protein
LFFLRVSTFSLLSSVVPAEDGVGFELPRVEVTMPVFSLVGRGKVQFVSNRRVVLEAEGERTCKQLRALMPPSPQRDDVQRFLDRQPAKAPAKAPSPHAGLRVQWDSGSPARPQWRIEPGCGLAPWPAAELDAAARK